MQIGLPPHPRELRERCFRLFAEGKCYTDIAFEARVPPSTIRAWASRDAWKQRLTQDPQLDTETAITLARQAAEPDIPLGLREQQERYSDNFSYAAVRLSETVRDMPTHELIQKADRIYKADATARKALRIENTPPACVINVALLSGSMGKQPRLVSDLSAAPALTEG